MKVDFLPFFIALKYDDRNYCTMLGDIFFQKILILRAFVKQSTYELVFVNISIYLIFILSVFKFNALFFSNSTVSKVFETGGHFKLIINIIDS